MAVSANIHNHSATCRKGNRGRAICRLSQPAGVHERETEPLCIRGAIADSVDKKLVYADKRVIRERTDGAIVWEQHRPAKDAMFVDTNLSLAFLTRSHTNSAVMDGMDAGNMVEEYQQSSYMTKEKGGLKFANTAMHTAISDILEYLSLAEDSGTNLRTAKQLAARAVNDFTGGNEWSHSLMAYALAGHRSFLSSDTFWYRFPHRLVKYKNTRLDT
ncbi:hypothetical protein JG687_00014556 [Phytophthora cactorum]|uniref:Uncharacterized protein n=1 Tax=Phytophthora cactorum TaxID=29920 RepID=A0A8T1TWP2_9STRA|nr:hypothetical protein JG687_00014556 [Phytophthora cactorum]